MLGPQWAVCLFCGMALSASSLCAAERENARTPQLTIQSRLFFVDPGSLKANFALKVTFDNSPQSVFLRFRVQGTDKDAFILADLLMHGMQVDKGGHNECTKRFEIDATDFSRIVKWKVVDVGFMHLDVRYNLTSLLVRAIPDSDDPSIGTLLFRAACSLDSTENLSDQVPIEWLDAAIQGLDNDGFERCHYRFSEYDCEGDSSSPARRGRWSASETAIEFDGFKRVFRPKDFDELPRIKTWRALPRMFVKSNKYGFTGWDGEPWDGEQP